MVKRIIVIAFVFFTSLSFAQKFGAGGSIDIMNPVGSKKFLPGISAFFDFPKTKTIALYGKVGYYFPTSFYDTTAYAVAINPMTSPYQVSAKNKITINTISLQGGSKYFVGNDYNVGFSGQFDTHFKVLISPYKSQITGYDSNLYRPDSSNQGSMYVATPKGVALTLYAGAGAGVKYSQPWGTVFASVSADIMLFYYKYTPLTSKFLLGFEIGYRRDIY